MTEVLVTVLQMIATIFIAFEYYFDKKKLNKLEKIFKKDINKVNDNRNKDVEYRLESHVKNKKRNLMIMVTSFFLAIIVIFSIAYMIIEKVFHSNVFYVTMAIVTVLLLTSSYFFSKLLDPLAEKIVTVVLFTFPQKIILLAKKSVFVGLGIFILLLSFILNLANILDVAVDFMKLISFFTLLIVFFYLGLFIKSYSRIR